MRRTLLTALVLGAAAFVGAFAASALTDEAVVVSGRTVYCTPSEFDEIPADIEDRCEAQTDDRRRQAIVAGIGAGLFSALAAAVILKRSPRA